MEQIKELLSKGTPKEKLSLFYFDIGMENDKILLKFNLWARYHFPQYFGSEDAPFHHEMNLYNLQAYKGQLDSFVNIAFRGAGKDVKTQLFITYCILNDTGSFRKYFKVLSDDGTNSVQSVTDIYNMLVNPKVTELYPNTFEKTVFKREERKDAFTTSKGVKVLADIVGSSQRGAKQEEARPDFIWVNDFETRKTLRSAVITRAIWDNLEEARTGLEKGGSMVYTCNYVSEVGNVHRLVTEKQSTRKKVFIVPIEKEDGTPAWSRYTKDNIAEMRKTDEDFEGERLCKPSASKDMYFDRTMLDKQIPKQPLRDIAGFKMFKEYNPAHAYAGGHDVAGGVGLDSSASVLFDFSTVPAQVVATFASNTILPEAFGDEIYSQGNRFGGCLLAVENNKYDQTILKAKQLGANLFMTPQRAIKSGYSSPTTYGWNTNSLTKSQALSSIREAVESGLVELNDQDLINEFKSYTRNDLIDTPPDVRLTTRHFDMLMAAAIGWMMKNNVRPAKKAKVDYGNSKGDSNPAI